MARNTTDFTNSDFYSGIAVKTMLNRIKKSIANGDVDLTATRYTGDIENDGQLAVSIAAHVIQPEALKLLVEEYNAQITSDALGSIVSSYPMWNDKNPRDVNERKLDIYNYLKNNLENHQIEAVLNLYTQSIYQNPFVTGISVEASFDIIRDILDNGYIYDDTVLKTALNKYFKDLTKQSTRRRVDFTNYLLGIYRDKINTVLPSEITSKLSEAGYTQQPDGSFMFKPTPEPTPERERTEFAVLKDNFWKGPKKHVLGRFKRAIDANEIPLDPDNMNTILYSTIIGDHLEILKIIVEELNVDIPTNSSIISAATNGPLRLSGSSYDLNNKAPLIKYLLSTTFDPHKKFKLNLNSTETSFFEHSFDKGIRNQKYGWEIFTHPKINVSKELLFMIEILSGLNPDKNFLSQPIKSKKILAHLSSDPKFNDILSASYRNNINSILNNSDLSELKHLKFFIPEYYTYTSDDDILSELSEAAQEGLNFSVMSNFILKKLSEQKEKLKSLSFVLDDQHIDVNEMAFGSTKKLVVDSNFDLLEKIVNHHSIGTGNEDDSILQDVLANLIEVYQTSEISDEVVSLIISNPKLTDRMIANSIVAKKFYFKQNKKTRQLVIDLLFKRPEVIWNWDEGEYEDINKIIDISVIQKLSDMKNAKLLSKIFGLIP